MNRLASGELLPLAKKSCVMTPPRECAARNQLSPVKPFAVILSMTVWMWPPICTGFGVEKVKSGIPIHAL